MKKLSTAIEEYHIIKRRRERLVMAGTISWLVVFIALVIFIFGPSFADALPILIHDWQRIFGHLL